MPDFKLPSAVPEKDESAALRDEIHEMYMTLGNAEMWDDYLFSAEDFVWEHGAEPDSRVGMWLMNKLLEQKVNEGVAAFRKKAEEYKEEVDQFESGGDGDDDDESSDLGVGLMTEHD